MSAATLRQRSSLACLLAVALTATACGSGSGSAASPKASATSGTTTTTAAATSAGAPTASSGTTTSSRTTAPAATGAPTSAGRTTSTPAPATTKLKATGGGAFCKNIATAVNNPITSTSATSLKDQKAQIEKGLAEGVAALSKAPAEIRPDAAIVLTAIDKLFKSLVKANYDYTKIDPKALAELSAPGVVAAEAHLAAYVKSTCGFSLGTG
ncbi:MAG: hypothetical protein QOJ11_1050 [Frankiales bacterium]|jgi:hypothetical protein|nr:hypothetical protein [Frankiales bacterium]